MSEGALDACVCWLLLKDMSCFLSAGALDDLYEYPLLAGHS
jgi:hypothetical protein